MSIRGISSLAETHFALCACVITALYKLFFTQCANFIRHHKRSQRRKGVPTSAPLPAALPSGSLSFLLHASALSDASPSSKLQRLSNERSPYVQSVDYSVGTGRPHRIYRCRTNTNTLRQVPSSYPSNSSSSCRTGTDLVEFSDFNFHTSHHRVYFPR